MICVATVTAIRLTAFYQLPNSPLLSSFSTCHGSCLGRTTILPHLVDVSQSLSAGYPRCSTQLSTHPSLILALSLTSMILLTSPMGHSSAFQQGFLLSASDSSTYTRAGCIYIYIYILGIPVVISKVICPTLNSFYFHPRSVPVREFCISMNINATFLTICSDKRE